MQEHKGIEIKIKFTFKKYFIIKYKHIQNRENSIMN